MKELTCVSCVTGWHRGVVLAQSKFVLRFLLSEYSVGSLTLLIHQNTMVYPMWCNVAPSHRLWSDKPAVAAQFVERGHWDKLVDSRRSGEELRTALNWMGRNVGSIILMCQSRIL